MSGETGLEGNSCLKQKGKFDNWKEKQSSGTKETQVF